MEGYDGRGRMCGDMRWDGGSLCKQRLCMEDMAGAIGVCAGVCYDVAGVSDKPVSDMPESDEPVRNHTHYRAEFKRNRTICNRVTAI